MYHFNGSADYGNKEFGKQKIGCTCTCITKAVPSQYIVHYKDYTLRYKYYTDIMVRIMITWRRKYLYKCHKTAVDGLVKHSRVYM